MQDICHLPDKEFKALSEENRLRILLFVHKHKLKCAYDKDGNKRCDIKCCVNDIAEHFDLALSTVSYHIKELVAADLIKITKKGRWSYCEINETKIKYLSEFFYTLIQ